MHRTTPSQLRNNARAASGHLEPLEGRTYFSIHAALAIGVGQLTIFGDNLANTIVVSRNAAGNILVNGGAVRVSGPAPTIANTRQIQVHAFGGNDQVSLDEANGALPKA